MKIKLQRAVWRIELPEELVGKAGFFEGENLECQTFPGGIFLLSQEASVTGAAKFSLPAEKKFAAQAETFLFWFFPIPAGRGAFAPEKWKSQGASGFAGL